MADRSRPLVVETTIGNQADVTPAAHLKNDPDTDRV